MVRKSLEPVKSRRLHRPNCNEAVEQSRGPWLALLCATTLVLIIASGCSEGGEQPQASSSRGNTESTVPQAAAPHSAIFTLLADNTLLKVSPSTGEVMVEVSLGPSYDRLSAGRYLAQSKSGKTIFALVRRGKDRASQVAMIDASTARVRDRYSLPEGVVFRSLAVGPKTGRLYLFGNRPGKKVRNDGDDNYREESVVVAVLDPDDGRMLENQTIREANGKDWSVYQGEVSSEESQLFVSYHGDTQGVDRITISPRGLERCQKQGAYPNQGCIPAHSGAETYRGRILVTPGDSPWVEERTRRGELVRKWDTKLEGNHMLDLALGAREDRLYALGSCGYRGGLSMVELKTNEVKVLAPTLPGVDFARERLVCGERLVVGPGSLLVVGKTAQAVPQARIPGSLLLVDGDTGTKVRTVDTPSGPADVLVVLRP